MGGSDAGSYGGYAQLASQLLAASQQGGGQGQGMTPPPIQGGGMSGGSAATPLGTKPYSEPPMTAPQTPGFGDPAGGGMPQGGGGGAQNQQMMDFLKQFMSQHQGY